MFFKWWMNSNMCTFLADSVQIIFSFRPFFVFLSQHWKTLKYYVLQLIGVHCLKNRARQFSWHVCVCAMVTCDKGLIWAVKMKNQLALVICFLSTFYSKLFPLVYSYGSMGVCGIERARERAVPKSNTLWTWCLKNVCTAVSSNSKFHADYIVSWPVISLYLITWDLSRTFCTWKITKRVKFMPTRIRFDK